MGALAALLLVAAGLFWWQGRAETPRASAPSFAAALPASPDTIPDPDIRGMRGPAPPEATELSKEQRRFDHVDKDRDGRITRNEMLSPRVAAFRKLDVDHNNLLTFDEWSIKTLNRFKGADANGDGGLTRPEFATTRAKKNAKPTCKCNAKVIKPVGKPRGGKQNPEPEPELPGSEGDGGEPEL